MSTIDQLRAEWLRHVAQYDLMIYILEKKGVSLRKPGATDDEAMADTHKRVQQMKDWRDQLLELLTTYPGGPGNA